MEITHLQHHGIKGQKWGVRRYQNPDGSLTAAGQKRQAKIDQKQAVKDKRAAVKNRRNMSDEELRARVNRLQMEKQLKQLTDEEVNRGREACKKTMGKIGDKALDVVMNTVGGIVGKVATGLVGAAASAAVKGGFSKDGFKENWDFKSAGDLVVNQFKKK